MRLGEAPDSTPRNAQQFTAFAADYDYVELITTPDCTNKMNPVDLLGAPVNAMMRQKAMFMLRDTPRPAAARDCNALAKQMRALQRRGALNFGYLPDDFLHDNPPLAQIAPALSLREYPLTPATKEK
jgi:biofilm PGA synthesis lipoprotein PgaB